MPETASKPVKKATKAAKPAKTGGSTGAAQKPAQAPKTSPLGRPVEYTDDIASEICWRIAHGEPLVRICADEHLPHVATIYRWLTRFPDFCDMYARAREDQADTLADEIQAIADEMPMETTDKDGNTRFDSAYINWMRLRVDARKWVAAKLKPRKYGDKVQVAGDPEGVPIKTEDTGSSRLFELIKNMEMAKRAG